MISIRNFWLIACLLIVGGPSVTKAQDRADYATVFQEAWQKINDLYYDPTFGGLDWESVRERYRPQVQKARSDDQFQEIMSNMLGELRVSHLWFRKPFQESESSVGVRTRKIDGKEVVTYVGFASDAQRQGVRVGDIILSTNDLSGPLGSNANLRLQDCSGHVRSLRVRRERIGQNEKPSIHWGLVTTGKGTGIGYIRALRFDDDAAPEIDQAMSDLAGTKALIIDVRENSGGNASFIRLSSYFTGDQHLVAALMMRPFMEKLGRAPQSTDITSLSKAVSAYTDEKIFKAMRSNGGAVALYSEDLGERRYKGKVVVLTSENTASAAEGFAWHMKTKSDAKFIGTTTAGELLGAEYFTLSGGWRLSVPTHAAFGGDGEPIIDKPIAPHIAVVWTTKDVCQGRDPDIARALEILSK